MLRQRTPRDLTRLADQASLHDLVMGRISRAGSRQDSPGKNSEVGSHALVQRNLLGKLESYQRGFELKHSFQMRKTEVLS